MIFLFSLYLSIYCCSIIIIIIIIFFFTARYESIPVIKRVITRGAATAVVNKCHLFLLNKCRHRPITTTWAGFLTNEQWCPVYSYILYIRSRLLQVRHTMNFSIEWCIYICGHDLGFPEILSATARMRICVCVLADCVVLPIRRRYYIYSTIYSGQRFLLPFFVSAPETAQRIQGPLTTRVIIGPGPVAAAASELRVSARPLPRHYRYIMYLHKFYYTSKSTARSFLLYVFFSPNVIYRLYTDAVPKRKHTSGCVSLLYSSVPVG